MGRAPMTNHDSYPSVVPLALDRVQQQERTRYVMMDLSDLPISYPEPATGLERNTVNFLSDDSCPPSTEGHFAFQCPSAFLSKS